jgi:hypothetical protein
MPYVNVTPVCLDLAIFGRSGPGDPSGKAKMLISTYGQIRPKSKGKQIIEKFCVIMPCTIGIGYEEMPFLVIKIPGRAPRDKPETEAVMLA